MTLNNHSHCTYFLGDSSEDSYPNGLETDREIEENDQNYTKNDNIIGSQKGKKQLEGNVDYVSNMVFSWKLSHENDSIRSNELDPDTNGLCYPNIHTSLSNHQQALEYGLYIKKSNESNHISTEEPSPKKAQSDLASHEEPATKQTRDLTSISGSYFDDPSFTDEEFNFKKSELKKSLSLKEMGNKRETAGCKKMVRFADALGLDLESVRHVLDADRPPYIPSSAKLNLRVKNDDQALHSPIGGLRLEAKFKLHSTTPLFRQSVFAQKVRLEKTKINGLCVSGFVWVLNIAFQKTVRVRYTTNNWFAFSEIMASYDTNSDDGQIDQFSFHLSAPPYSYPGARLELAISYSVSGNVYWDNNHGQNYVFECALMESPSSVGDNTLDW